MEDWEKKFAELEAEVDADFAKTAAAKKQSDSDDESERQQRAVKAEPSAATEEDDSPGLLDDIKQRAATKALEKVAERSLTNVNPRMAVVAGVGTLLGLWLIWANLFKLIFIGGTIGLLYYFMVARHQASDDDDAGDDDDD